jgi:hypothetical protein
MLNIKYMTSKYRNSKGTATKMFIILKRKNTNKLKADAMSRQARLASNRTRGVLTRKQNIRDFI